MKPFFLLNTAYDEFLVGINIGERHIHISEHEIFSFVGVILCLGIFDICIGFAKHDRGHFE